MADEPLRMTRSGLATALHRVAEDAAKIQLRLRGLGVFLGAGEPAADHRLETCHDALRAVSCRLADLATAVRLGEVPVAAYAADGTKQLPLFPDGEPKPKRQRARRPKPGLVTQPTTFGALDDEVS